MRKALNSLIAVWALLVFVLMLIWAFMLLNSSFASAAELNRTSSAQWTVPAAGPVLLAQADRRRSRVVVESGETGPSLRRAAPAWRPGDQMEDSRRRRGAALVDPNELLSFLEKNEPDTAAQLKQLNSSDPQKYERRISLYQRLYTPVIHQMQRNPQMGQLSLRQLQLKMKIHETLKDARDTDTKKAGQAREQLKAGVADLFDVILDKEKLMFKNMEEFVPPAGPQASADVGPAAGRAARRFHHAQPGPGPVAGPGEPGFGPPAGPGEPDLGPPPAGPGEPDLGPPAGPGEPDFGPPAAEGKLRQEIWQKHLERRQKLWQSWQQHKKEIVDQHVAELLEGTESFPWGR